jgi:hypothetical protein
MNLWTELAQDISRWYPNKRREKLSQLLKLHDFYKGDTSIATEFAVRRKLGIMKPDEHRDQATK